MTEKAVGKIGKRAKRAGEIRFTIRHITNKSFYFYKYISEYEEWMNMFLWREAGRYRVDKENT